MLCNKSHEYVYEEDGNYFVGVTDVLLNKLGKIEYIELPEPGEVFAKGEIFGCIEGAVQATELYTPLTVTVLEVNKDLVEHSENLTAENFNSLWFMKTTGDYFYVDKNDLIPYEEYKKIGEPNE